MSAIKDRSAEEIQAEIKALEACKAYAPKRTIFGDDNHQSIDRQIEALKGEIDTTADEFNYFTDDEQSNILYAIDWMEGREEEAPSAGWDSFKKPPYKKEDLKLKRQGCAGQRQPSPTPKRGKKS